MLSHEDVSSSSGDSAFSNSLRLSIGRSPFKPLPIVPSISWKGIALISKCFFHPKLRDSNIEP